MKKKRLLMLFTICTWLVGCEKLDEPDHLVPKTADQDSSIPSIKINDRVLHSEVFGDPDDTLIICIHGGPGADYRYMLAAKDLAQYGYKVVFYDQVGSGLSQRFNENYYSGKDLDDIFLNELDAVIDFYKTRPNQKVVLFGHSWGAILATSYAGKKPNEIDGMILIEPGGLKWNDIEEYIKKAQAAPLGSEILNDILFQDQFVSTKKDNHEILDYKFALIASHGSPNTLETLTGKDSFWRFGSVINLTSFNYGQKFKPDMGQGIENFQDKVLFMYGGAGKVYSDEWARKISYVYKNKELVKIEGVGHSGMLESDKWRSVTLPSVLNYLKTI
ncbi:alpha/beta hydrolase [Algoriphagus lacus]|uniref:Alpha/beta hydrolase n=1 Tax=Algoriphagus lacus TaxID=2056311 RepID=A0A418PNC1_9BACT|nr:alpha/beta hydrolase [Algoriphagus lacus]RIW13339.1 alpha/beta hydrolase [Algoriphagus lacus]